MAGKASVLASSRLFYAMDKLSKNALIDLIVDRARAEIGEDADDESVAELIEGWIRPVANVRNDRSLSLRSAMADLDAKNADYIRKQQPHKCAKCDTVIVGGDLCITCSKLGSW